MGIFSDFFSDLGKNIDKELQKKARKGADRAMAKDPRVQAHLKKMQKDSEELKDVVDQMLGVGKYAKKD